MRVSRAVEEATARVEQRASHLDVVVTEVKQQHLKQDHKAVIIHLFEIKTAASEKKIGNNHKYTCRKWHKKVRCYLVWRERVTNGAAPN